MTTARQLAAERTEHARLDEMATACGRRTITNRTHLGCAYCAHLARYYEEQARTWKYKTPASGRIR